MVRLIAGLREQQAETEQLDEAVWKSLEGLRFGQ